MKFKKIILTLFCVLISFQVVSADETTETNDVTLSVKRGAMVDPDPDPNSKDPAPNTQTNFRLWKIPTELNFENIKFDNKNHDINKVEVLEIDPSIESVPGSNRMEKDLAVGDLRMTAEGWNVTAKLKDGKMTGRHQDGRSVDVFGAEINFKSTVGSWDVLQSPHAWVPLDSNIEATGTTINNASQSLMHALGRDGLGYNGIRMYDIQLTMPGGYQYTAGFQYSGEVVWTLNNGPQ